MGVGAVVSIIGLVAGVAEGRKARKAQEKAEKISGRRADLANAKANRRRIAQARRLRAQTIAAGEAGGVGGGSGVAGAAGSVQTTAAVNVSFQNQLAGLDAARFDALSEASSATSKAATFSAIGAAPAQLGFSPAKEIQSFFNK